MPDQKSEVFIMLLFFNLKFYKIQLKASELFEIEKNKQGIVIY